MTSENTEGTTSDTNAGAAEVVAKVPEHVTPAEHAARGDALRLAKEMLEIDKRTRLSTAWRLIKEICQQHQVALEGTIVQVDGSVYTVDVQLRCR